MSAFMLGPIKTPFFSFIYVVGKPYVGQIGEQAEASQSRLKYSAGDLDGKVRENTRRNDEIRIEPRLAYILHHNSDANNFRIQKLH
jgi:hypothetical protein